MQQYAVYILLYCTITLHVSGAVRTIIRSCSYSHRYKSCIRAATSLQRDQKTHIVGHVKEFHMAHPVNNFSQISLPCNITNRKCVCVCFSNIMLQKAIRLCEIFRTIKTAELQ